MPNCVKDGWGGICPGCDGVQCVVPSGMVPRATSGWVQRVDTAVLGCPGCGVPEPELHQPGCLQKVVDDYLLMERKARAWDLLRQGLFPSEARVLVAMDALITPHP